MLSALLEASRRQPLQFFNCSLYGWYMGQIIGFIDVSEQMHINLVVRGAVMYPRPTTGLPVVVALRRVGSALLAQ